MAGGLFHTLFEKQGIYGDLFSRHGATPPLHRTDLRLGQLDEEDEDEEEGPSAAKTPLPEKKSLFQTHVIGIPVWLLGVALLGFAIQVRKNRK